MEYLKSKVQNLSKTVGKRTEIDEITTVALVLQRFFGHQVLNPNWTWKRFYLHQLLNLFLFIYVFFGTLEILRETTDADLIAEACYTIIMTSVFPVKAFLFINNRVLFRKLYMIGKTTLVDTIRRESEQKLELVLKKVRTIVYVLFSIVLIPCSIYELTWFWNYLNGNFVLLSRSTSTLMPMRTPFIEMAWFFHTIFLFEVSTTIILDMWFVLLIFLLCAANESTAKRLSVEDIMENESETEYAKRLNDVLRIFYHEQLKQVKYLKTLNRMYKWLAFVPLCNAAMCMCIMLLIMSKEVNWKFAPHVMPMFAEIFAYNWFGEQIKTKAQEIKMALLNFDWTSLDAKGKKCYYILILQMNRESGIRTAVGNDLSLVTMSMVLKVTYQSFTVLQSMGD